MKVSSEPVTFGGQRVHIEFSSLREREIFEDVVRILRARIDRRSGERQEPIDGILLRRTSQADLIRKRPELIKEVVGIESFRFAGEDGPAGRTLSIVPLPDHAPDLIAA